MTTNDEIKQITKAHTHNKQASNQVYKQANERTNDRSIDPSTAVSMQSDPRYDTSKVKQRRNSNNNNNSPERRSNETNEKRKKKNDFHYFIKTYVKSYPIYILLKLNVRAERYTDLSAIICSSRISDSDSGSGDGDRDDSNKWHGTTMTTNFRKRSNRTQFGQYITTFNFIMQIWMLGAHCARIFGTVIISFDSIHLLFSFFLTPCYLELPRECKLLRI